MYVCVAHCLYVCMYICMTDCLYACMYGCVDVSTHVCIYACMDVCMHVCMFVCVCVIVCMYVCTSSDPCLFPQLGLFYMRSRDLFLIDPIRLLFKGIDYISMHTRMHTIDAHMYVHV